MISIKGSVCDAHARRRSRLPSHARSMQPAHGGRGANVRRATPKGSHAAAIPDSPTPLDVRGISPFLRIGTAGSDGREVLQCAPRPEVARLQRRSSRRTTATIEDCAARRSAIGETRNCERVFFFECRGYVALSRQAEPRDLSLARPPQTGNRARSSAPTGGERPRCKHIAHPGHSALSLNR